MLKKLARWGCSKNSDDYGGIVMLLTTLGIFAICVCFCIAMLQIPDDMKYEGRLNIQSLEFRRMDDVKKMEADDVKIRNTQDELKKTVAVLESRLDMIIDLEQIRSLQQINK